MNWLLSNDEFRGAVRDNDCAYIILLNNGVICENDAKVQFICSSTEYDAPDCPICLAQDNNHYPIGKDLWKCKKCLNKFTITSKRYLDNTKIPLTHWWRFCWLTEKNKRFNSCEISRDLGITQKSAYGMVTTLRMSMKNSNMRIDKSCIDIDIWDAMKLLMNIK